MSIIREPNVTYDLVAAPTLVQNAPQKVLVMGQQLTDTSISGSLITNIGVSGQEDALFGKRSQIATQIREFRRLNSVTQIDAIPLNDAGGATAAAGSITFVGSATGNGTFEFYIQSKTLHSFSVAVTDGDTDATIANNVVTAINADDTILVSADSTTPGTVDLISTTGGTAGNFVNIGIPVTVAGVSVSKTAFTGGATNPDISTVLTVIGDTRYQQCITPDGYDKTVLATFFDARFNVSNNVLDGRVLQMNTESATALVASVASLNSQSFVNFGNKGLVGSPTLSGGATKEYNAVCVAQFAANAALRLTEGQNISNIVVGNAGSGDNFGGIWTAPIPYANMPFPRIALGDTHLGWSSAEQTQLTNGGCSYFGNNPGNTSTIVGEVVTTYLTDPITGNPSTIWKYLSTVVTASVIREFYVDNNREEFAMAVLTQGDIIPNRKQTGVDDFNAAQATLYTNLATTYGLVPAGNTALTFYKQNIASTENLAEGTIQTIQTMPVNPGLRGINGTLQISFDVQTR